MNDDIKKLILIFAAALLLYSFGQANKVQALVEQNDHQFFIENKGQWPAKVKFQSRIGGMNAWITDSGVAYDYYQISHDNEHEKIVHDHKTGTEISGNSTSRIIGHVVRAELENTNSSAIALAKERVDACYNFFIGNDESK